LLALVFLNSCALGRDDEPEAASLEPKFDSAPPAQPSQPTSPPTVGATSSSAPREQRAGSPTTSPAQPAGTTAAPTQEATPGAPTTASLSDKKGDVTLSLDRPPTWADIVGGTLTRRADVYELRIRMGGTVPSTYDRDHTINVASFYDVDGNGSIDHEVWVNLASGGWGGSYFDNTKRGGSRINDDALAIQPQGDELVVTFPLEHLKSASRMQWALAMEWGRYDVIGTAAAARDDAPDNDGAAQFPN
jgi:hypothetical protein